MMQAKENFLPFTCGYSLCIFFWLHWVAAATKVDSSALPELFGSRRAVQFYFLQPDEGWNPLSAILLTSLLCPYFPVAFLLSALKGHLCMILALNLISLYSIPMRHLFLFSLLCVFPITFGRDSSSFTLLS